MGNDRIPFLPGCCYHLYNHGNADDTIFRSDENYRYFLWRYSYYSSIIADTYAYCLMPNHFHFLIRMKTVEEILLLNTQGFKNLMGLNQENYNKKVAQQFGNFLNSYSKSFNKKYNRRGSLFLDNVKRKKVESKTYFKNVMHYIHLNPIHHGFVKEIAEWKHSSYHSILSMNDTQLKRNDVIEVFGGRDKFLENHANEMDRRLILEMDF